MKKLFYIILIVFALVLTSKYVKDQHLQNRMNELKASISDIEEDNSNTEDDIVTTTSYGDDVDGMIIEGTEDLEYNDENLIEENPELTQDDEETIIAE